MNIEFRRHQKVDNPLHIIGFLSQWKLYLDDLTNNSPKEYRGRKLDPTVVEKVPWRHALCLYRPVLLMILAIPLVVFRCPQNRLVNCTSSCRPQRMCGKQRTRLTRALKRRTTRSVIRKLLVADTCSIMANPVACTPRLTLGVCGLPITLQYHDAFGPEILTIVVIPATQEGRFSSQIYL